MNCREHTRLGDQHKGPPEKEVCFICEMTILSEDLHEASALDTDSQVCKRAFQLQDQCLLAKLQGT